MKGWESVPLGEVARIERVVVEPTDIDPESTYVGLEHIGSDGSFVAPARAGERLIESSKFVFSRRHVLYGKLRPYLAKIACPEFDGVCSTDVLPILPGPHVARRFLYHFLRQPEIVARATSLSAGANLPRLSPSVLATFPIPLPAQGEQLRIAEILDRADSLRAKRRVTLAELDGLTQAIFLELFGDPATPSRRHPRVALGKLGSWQSGGTPPRSEPSYFVGDIPWFSSGELGAPEVSNSAEVISARALRETSAKRVLTGC